MKAFAEEPVVTKRARITEEIRVHADRDEHVQKIAETLRHTDVKVAELPSIRTFDVSRYRDHFDKTYAAATSCRRSRRPTSSASDSRAHRW